jgi:hypothetical protein
MADDSSDLFEQQTDAPFEPVLDLPARRVGVGHVHDVHVQRPAVFRQVDRDAAGRDVDEHRQQQDFAVARDVERNRDDSRLDPVASQHVGGDAKIGKDQFPREEHRQIDRAHHPGRQRGRHDPASGQQRQNQVAHEVADEQVRESDLPLQGGPGEREENAAE